MKKKLHHVSNQISKSKNEVGILLLLLALLLGPLASYAQNYVQLGNDIDGQFISEQSGLATSLSHDGKRIAVGSTFIGNSELSPGLVRVYEIVNDTWVQLGEDIVGENLEDEFGTAVSLNSDGTVVAIGAPENDGGADRAGHIRMYVYANGHWSQMGSDLDGEDINEGFGTSIDLSADGQRVIAGSRFGRTNGLFTGNARVYDFDNGVWTQLGPDLGSTIANESYGWAVSMSDDGSKIAIGAPLNDDLGFNYGRVEVLEWNNNSWVLFGSQIDGVFESGAFGTTLNLNGAGDRIVIGASACGDPNTQGAAQVYEFTGSDWTTLGNSITGTNPLSCFASSVDINTNGDRVVVGDPVQGPNGLTRVFQLDAGTWNQVGDDILGELQGDQSGSSVSMSRSGAEVSMGANVNSDGVQSGGQARVFQDESLLGVEDVLTENFDIVLYPNPVDEFIQIENRQQQLLSNIYIFDLSGRILQEYQPEEHSDQISIQVASLQTGVYQIVIKTSSNTQVVKRFVKK